MSQDLQQILSSPHAKIATIGPKKDRAVINYCIVMGLATVLGAAGAFGFLTAKNNGLNEEFQAAKMNVADHTPVAQDIQWVQTPSTPFLEVAKNNGMYSLGRLLRAYHHVGISPDDAASLVNFFPRLSVLVTAGHDEVLASQHIADATKIVKAMETLRPDQARQLQALIGQDVSSDLNFDQLVDKYYGAVTLWAQQSYSLEEDVLEDIDEAQAKEAIEEAMLNTGLRALKIAPSGWSNPDQIYNFATNLNLANEDLKTVTDWDGQVLGLGGRVVLNVALPPQEYTASGVAMKGIDGVVELYAGWGELSHEWFHALDYVVAQKTLKHSSIYTLSSQMQPLRWVVDHAVWDSWKDIRDQIKNTTQQWQISKDERIEEWKEQTHHAHATNEEQYWHSTSETLAYAFQSHMHMNTPAILSHNIIDEQLSYRLPSEQETQQNASHFNKLFVNLSHLNLTKPMTLKHGSLNEKVYDQSPKVEQVLGW